MCAYSGLHLNARPIELAAIVVLTI
jgi:hypothetical protein